MGELAFHTRNASNVNPCWKAFHWSVIVRQQVHIAVLKCPCFIRRGKRAGQRSLAEEEGGCSACLGTQGAFHSLFWLHLVIMDTGYTEALSLFQDFQVAQFWRIYFKVVGFEKVWEFLWRPFASWTCFRGWQRKCWNLKQGVDSGALVWSRILTSNQSLQRIPPPSHLFSSSTVGKKQSEGPEAKALLARELFIYLLM